MKPFFKTIIIFLLFSPSTCVNAAWYQDRDNSMLPINLNDSTPDARVGRAMAIVKTKTRVINQAIQVCKNVYLTVAHGTLDDPYKARKRGRLPFKAHEMEVTITPYFKDKTPLMSMNALAFISPRINKIKNWNKHSTDYVFITVKNSLRPYDYVEPLKSQSTQLIKYFKENSKSKLHLYRGLPLFKIQELFPVFHEENNLKSSEILKTPQKVFQECSLLKDVEKGFTATDCPSESGASGSPYISVENNTPYLHGIHVLGSDLQLPSFSKEFRDTAFLNSSQFCKDYQKACHKPCKILLSKNNYLDTFLDTFLDYLKSL